VIRNSINCAALSQSINKYPTQTNQTPYPSINPSTNTLSKPIFTHHPSIQNQTPHLSIGPSPNTLPKTIKDLIHPSILQPTPYPNQSNTSSIHPTINPPPNSSSIHWCITKHPTQTNQAPHPSIHHQTPHPSIGVSPNTLPKLIKHLIHPSIHPSTTKLLIHPLVLHQTPYPNQSSTSSIHPQTN